MPGTMHITCHMVRGYAAGHFFDVSVDASVECLRELVCSKRMIPMPRMIMSYAGVQLEDGRLLSDYGISGDATIAIDDVLTIKVKLQEFCGGLRARTFDVSPQMNLGELRYIAGQVVGESGIGLLGLGLAVGHRRCFDIEDTLTTHRITDGSEVTIVRLPLPPPKRIRVY